jgi:uncharacterized membrane protein
MMRGLTMLVVAIGVIASGLSVSARGRSDKAETLVYAVYQGENTAADVFKSMVKGQHATGERIEAYAIVSKDLKGKVRVRDQRKTDAGIGAAIGGVIGLLGGPVTAAIAAGAGGAAGYLTGEAVGISKEKVEEMRVSLTPDSSALVVVLDDKWVKDVQHSLEQAQARAVIANQIAAGTK